MIPVALSYSAAKMGHPMVLRAVLPARLEARFVGVGSDPLAAWKGTAMPAAASSVVGSIPIPLGFHR